ncbi:hypothetical protein SLS58_007431 [Diplodia intermedia]|uniref:Rhodopsin domain-containing protein n=1 Tax=Diplodia intermedia TaxID=856260 RepID=A0ABR3TL97_9PEZI
MTSFSESYQLDGTQKVLRAVIIASICITGVFIATRCWIRVRLQAKFSSDDYLLVAALVAFAIQTGFGLYSMDHGGFGRKTADLPRDVYVLGLKWMVLTQCTYTIALMFAKLSIGLLQLRVMGLSTSTLRRMHHATIALTIVVSTYEFLTLLFQCYPTPSTASSAHPVYQPVLIPTAPATATCAARRTPILVSVYLYSAANIALDWYYSLAMVPLILRLQNMKAVVKASAIAILGIGVVASVATIIRLKYLVGFADSTDPLSAIVPGTGPDGVRMEELELEAGGRLEDEEDEEEWDDGVCDEECGGRRARAGTRTDPGVGGGVVEYDVDDGGGDIAVREDDRFHHHDGIDDGTTTIMTTRTMSSGGKDNVDVQTVLSDADSQKSILQQKSADSWRS